MRTGCSLVVAVVLALGGASVADPAPADVWGAFDTPFAGPARAIGGYSRGCVAGAVRLARTGPGFRVARPERRRDYGHPSLVAFIRELAGRARDARLGVLAIGDLGQPRGGPARGGHASHQTGLDVDIWYKPGARRSVSMIDAPARRASRHLDDSVRALLRLVVADPRVDRVIVNPLVKRALCEDAGEDRGWLAKLRPWWGHDEHFHVRLRCPEDSPACEPQPAIGGADGCADLDWWLDPQATAERDTQREVYRARLGGAAPLPEGCGALVGETETATAASPR